MSKKYFVVATDGCAPKKYTSRLAAAAAARNLERNFKYLGIATSAIHQRVEYR